MRVCIFDLSVSRDATRAAAMFAFFAAAGCAPDWNPPSERDASKQAPETADTDEETEEKDAAPSKRRDGGDMRNEDHVADAGQSPRDAAPAEPDAERADEGTMEEPDPPKDAGKPTEPTDAGEASKPDAKMEEPEPEPEPPADPCLTATCDTNATCTAVDGKAKCTCKSPFVGDGMTCASCSTLKCGAHASCKATSTAVSCQCEQGYEKSLFDDKSCVDINECLNPLHCGLEKDCKNTDGSAECSCPTVAPGPNLIQDPGFEGQGTTVGPPWVGSTNSPDTATFAIGPGRTGAKAARGEQTTGWFDFFQIVDVEANTDYKLTGWYRSGNATKGHIGVRSITHEAPFAESAELASPFWTAVTVQLNSGDRTQLVVFGGTWAPGPGMSTWEVDDFSLQKQPANTCN